MGNLNRRELFKLVAFATFAAPVSAKSSASASTDKWAGRAPDTLRFFPGFTSARVKTSGAEINLVHAGSGPPLLLMHGAPQTHVSMRRPRRWRKRTR